VVYMLEQATYSSGTTKKSDLHIKFGDSHGGICAFFHFRTVNKVIYSERFSFVLRNSGDLSSEL
jgi:hypothetical protein